MSFDRTKPEIDFPGAEPPADLVTEDQIVGEGTEAVAGSTVLAHYVGVAHSTGEEFDASWNRGEPLRFRLGVGQVIAGWDQGLQGMKVGGRRTITIPPHLGYGAGGAGPIKPNETLIFVVDLVEVA
jgi:peptidylprolyl isomerase